MFRELRDANVGFLQQGVQLLETLTDAQYQSGGHHTASGVGAHLRHVLDHYRCFLNGLGTGKIDYDARTRETSVERSPGRGIEVTRELIAELNGLEVDDANRAVQTCMQCGNDADAFWTTSSIARELQFLVSHTVHHYALIKGLLTEHGVQVDRTFGVAPSTLVHDANAPCAH